MKTTLFETAEADLLEVKEAMMRFHESFSAMLDEMEKNLETKV